MPELPRLVYVAEIGGGRRLTNGERLLARWVEAYAHALRPKLLLGRYRAERAELLADFEATRYDLWLGGEPAAARMTGHLRPGTLTFYGAQPEARLLVDLRLRLDPDGNVPTSGGAFGTSGKRLASFRPSSSVPICSPSAKRAAWKPQRRSTSVTLLDFSERRELREIAQVLGAVQAAATGSPVMLVGAMARDLLLLHAHCIDTVRATNDLDIAIAVPDWGTFERLRVGLLSKGFRPGPVPHKLYLDDFEVDAIPFGALERPDRQIAWPPRGEHVMS
jgi:hypothetical protein